MGRRLRRLAVLGVLLATAARSDPARADEPAPPAPESNAAQDEARERFMRAVRLYEDGDFKLALIEFERAYDVAPSYKMLFNIGHVHNLLGHYAKAIATLERYLADGAGHIPAERRQQVETEILELQARTARLSVATSVADAEIVLDGTALGRGSLRGQLVDAGEHRLHVSRAGYEPDDRVLVIAGGDAVSVDVALRRAVPRSEAPRPVVTPAPATGIWLGWAGAGALAAGAGVCGALALDSSTTLRDQKDTPGTSYAERDRTATRAQTFGVATDVLAGAAVVTAGITLYFMLTRPSAARRSASPASTSPAPSPLVGAIAF